MVDGSWKARKGSLRQGLLEPSHNEVPVRRQLADVADRYEQALALVADDDAVEAFSGKVRQAAQKCMGAVGEGEHGISALNWAEPVQPADSTANLYELAREGEKFATPFLAGCGLASKPSFRPISSVARALRTQESMQESMQSMQSSMQSMQSDFSSEESLGWPEDDESTRMGDGSDGSESDVSMGVGECRGLMRRPAKFRPSELDESGRPATSCAWVTDVLRYSSVAGSLRSLRRQLVALFRACTGETFTLVLLNNRFRSAVETKSGYRDVLALVRHEPTKLVFEVQFHLAALADVHLAALREGAELSPAGHCSYKDEAAEVSGEDSTGSEDGHLLEDGLGAERLARRSPKASCEAPAARQQPRASCAQEPRPSYARRLFQKLFGRRGSRVSRSNA